MKFIKLLIIASILMISIFNSNVLASELPDVSYSQEEINQMSDDEFVKMIVEFNRYADQEGYTTFQKQKALETVGVEFSEKSQPLSRVGGYNPSDAEILLYVSKRSGQSYCYNTASITANVEFLNPGEEDILSIEWDPSERGEYYGVSTPSEGHCTYMDGTQRKNGIVMFNLNDIYLKKGCTAYASVLIKCLGSDGNHEFASKYIHTYNTRSYSWQLGINFTYNKAAGGGFTFALTGNSVGKTWQLYGEH